MTTFNARLKAFQQGQASGFFWDVAHFIYFAVRRFFAERMTNAAAALTYSTLLALVPLLVIAFAILSSFPAFDAVKGRMQELFFSIVVPEAGAAVSDYLANFTQNASNLTTVGIVALAVAAVLLLSTVEDTLNRVWHVERPRPIVMRFLIFWAILTLGPMLVAVSFTLTTDLRDIAAHTDLLRLGVPSDVSLPKSRVLDTAVSVVISTVGFTALFVLVPARRVRIRHALIGGAFAAVSFEVLAWGFNTFLTSGSSYETIYGAVAVVPVFLVWVYTSWMVIILGAVFAAAFPDWWQSRSAALMAELESSDRLEVAVTLLARLHRHAQTGGALDEEVLAESVPLEARDEIMDTLREAGFVAESEDGKVLLARDLSTATLYDLAQAMGLSLGVAPGTERNLPESVVTRLQDEAGEVRGLLERLYGAETEILGVPLAQVFAETGDGRDAMTVDAAAE